MSCLRTSSKIQRFGKIILIAQIKELGIITEKEFNEKKKKILDRI